MSPPRRVRVRRPRQLGPTPSPVSRALSGALIVLVIGAGVVLGWKVSRSTQSHPPVRAVEPNVALRDANGALHLWGTVGPAPAGDLFWGAFRLGAPYQRGLVTSLALETQSRPDVIMWYQEWAGRPDFPARDVAWLFHRGIVPMITWEPWKPPRVFGTVVNHQPQYSLRRIADGAWDSYIHRYALEIKRYGGPVMLRPMHEMDGNWYPWSGTAQQAEGNSSPEYVRAWRHMWTIFHAVGATNVTWVWSVNHVSLPNTPQNQIQTYWPGSRYVDWVGISGFNWGTSSPKEVWKGFDSIALARYQELLRYHKPIALTEMGAPETGGNKALWIRQTFHAIFDRYPRLKMVVWYDKEDTAQRQWQIDSSSASLQAFRAAVADPRVLQADSALATARPNLGS